MEQAWLMRVVVCLCWVRVGEYIWNRGSRLLADGFWHRASCWMDGLEIERTIKMY